jgi:hypothetical protein
MSGKVKVPITISELTSPGIFSRDLNLADGFPEDTVMRELEHFVRLEEEGPCEGQSHGLYFSPTLCQCPR